MRILITRHGETDANREGIIQGHLDTKLSDLGREQARRLAERLRDEKIDLIVSSDLSRAADTAREVARFHDCEVVFDGRLRNRNFKEFNGKRREEFAKTREEATRLFDSDLVETIEEVDKRALSLIEDLAKKNADDILLVGHWGINRSIMGILMGKSSRDFSDLKIKNASLCVLTGEIGKMKMGMLNCVEHLDED